MKPLAIDLFCGAGGMSEGIIQAGFHIVFSSDKSEEASLTYKNRHEELGLQHNYNTFFETNDIANLTGQLIKDKIYSLPIFNNIAKPEIKAIFGGPPCQGFSRAGLRKKDDPRNFLFKEYIRVISEIMPDYVVMENVVGLLDTKLDNFISVDKELYPDNYNITNILENEFKKLGYIIKSNENPEQKINFKNLILDASEFGVPQKRERMIIIAHKKGIIPPKDISNYKISKRVSVEEAIADLIINSKLRKKTLQALENQNKMDFIIDSKSGRTKHIEHELPINHTNFLPQNYEMASHLPHISERFSLFNEGETTKHLKERLKKEGVKSLKKIENLIKYTFEEINKNDLYFDIEAFRNDLKNLHKLTQEKQEIILVVFLSKKNLRTKLDRQQPCRTVVTLPDDFISPFEDRIFSVRELARIQSFDDSFVFLGKRTTGGQRRKFETPQYTQVGNAVPPLLAKAVAKSIIDVIE